MSRLAQNIRTNRQQLERFRTIHKELVREYVGHLWSEEGAEREVLVNLMALYVQVMGRQLIFKTPRFHLSTFDPSQKPAVNAMMQVGNKYIERIALDRILRRSAVNSLFSIGITQVCLATPAHAAASNFRVQAGWPYAANIDLDDWGFDPHARCEEDAAFMYHRMRVPLHAVRESKIFGPKRRKLEPTEDAQFNYETGDERLSMIGRIYRGTQEEVQDMIDLWQVWDPAERAVHFFASAAGMTPEDGDEPLLSQSWVGPYCGPYHLCGMFPVPGQMMPKAPLQDLAGLHCKHNSTMRKLADDVANMKELTLVGGAALEDGDRINEASDGDSIGIRNLGEIKQYVSRGSMLQQLTGMATFFKETFDFMGGNLALVGGRSQQASTATQEKILNENAGAGIADMQETASNHAASVIRSILWYIYKHPERVYSYEHKAGPKLPSLIRQIHPAGAKALLTRDADFDSLDYRLDTYSMRPKTPEERLQFILQMVTQVFAPLVPLWQAAGVSLDMHKLAEKMCELGDEPDLSDCFSIMEPTAQPGAGGGAQPPSQPGGGNTYNRVNPSTQTQQGQAKSQVTQMLSGKSQGGNPAQSGAPTAA